ncbi:hypothetical protein RHSIM_Rhsim02G0230900 [Rhododendron simsii]|uniref:Uncharacterized protein n=1 Tax=Rhododendron simsii TaxID=118357 RepID=A0A834HBB9_RHOSS|nr:hypothetical protein RHSIM_Rhsim02G0230900 [Rhododendron simsii]
MKFMSVRYQWLGWELSTRRPLFGQWTRPHSPNEGLIENHFEGSRFPGAIKHLMNERCIVILLSFCRCESILQPGYNCTFRLEKNRAKARRSRHKRPNISTQNNVIYTCHFCSHQNLKRGTPRGHTKDICPPKAKSPMKSKSSSSIVLKSVNSEKPAMSNPEVKRTDEIASPAMTTEDLVTETPATPSVSTCTTLLETKRKKRNRSGSKKAAESESNSDALDAEKSVGTSNKRKMKPWSCFPWFPILCHSFSFPQGRNVGALVKILAPPPSTPNTKLLA